jgi:hypothetical protein
LIRYELNRRVETLKNGGKFSQFQMRFMEEQFEKYVEVRDRVTSINVSEWDNPSTKCRIMYILHDDATKTFVESINICASLLR